MTDLITRLRDSTLVLQYGDRHAAADELEAQAELLRSCSVERDELAAKWYGLRAAAEQAKAALSAMLTHMGMDEDAWNRPTFNQARESLRALDAALEVK